MHQLSVETRTTEVRPKVSALSGSRNWRCAVMPLWLLAAVALAGCGGSTPSDKSEIESGSPVSSAGSSSDVGPEPDTRDKNSRLDDVTGSSQSPGVPDAPVDPPVVSPTRPQQIYRPNFTPREFDDAMLASRGIHRFASKRAVLYTDIDPEQARSLPAVIDAVYDAWSEYFGELPPARDGREFQVTGFIIRDRQLFSDLGLIPIDLPPFIHGRHRGLEFWMLEQETDYYRKHLMIHEATHCFMTIVEPSADPRPVWYLEGMAEIFGTHQSAEDGLEFRIMPADNRDFPGLGRITLVQTETAADRHKSLDALISFAPTRFLENDAYGWTWAMCEFLDRHPRWKSDFRKLGQQFTGTSFRRLFVTLFAEDMPRMRSEWQLFSRQLVPGYDLDRASVSWEPAARPQPQVLAIKADRGWQNTGIRVQKGQKMQVTASGDAVLAETTRPWLSHPDGITVRYIGAHPIGQLLACVYDESDPLSLLKAFPVGSSKAFEAPADGLIMLKINDAPDELSDNRGSYTVRVSAQQ